MKTVFNSNSDLMHFYANNVNNQNYATSNSVFFRANIIYSYGYHFPMSVIINENDLLFTLNSYSVSTSKHLNLLHQATRQYNKIYSYDIIESSKGNHEPTFEAWKNEASKVIEKLNKANKPEIYILQLQQIKTYVDNYIKYFKIKMPNELKLIFSIETKNSDVLNKLVKLKASKVAKELKEKLTKFYNFETDYITSVDHDYIRYNKITEIVETSQRVKIPKLEALKFYFALFFKSLKVGDTVLNFTVLKITDKAVQIGCHTLLVSDINKMYKIITA
jgi:hypothetical protein